MLSVTRAPLQRPESPTFVVLVTAMQLGLVVLVWILALIPAAIAALIVLSFKAVRGVLRKAPAVLTPMGDGR